MRQVHRYVGGPPRLATVQVRERGILQHVVGKRRLLTRQYGGVGGSDQAADDKQQRKCADHRVELPEGALNSSSKGAFVARKWGWRGLDLGKRRIAVAIRLCAPALGRLL